MAYFGTEFKSAKIIEKSTLETHQTFLCRKWLEETPHIREMTRFLKVGKMAILHVGYSKAKRPVLGRNLKVPKSQKKYSRNTLKLFYAANSSKKRLLFQK